jgi:hypothetical protein
MTLFEDKLLNFKVKTMPMQVTSYYISCSQDRFGLIIKSYMAPAGQPLVEAKITLFED